MRLVADRNVYTLLEAQCHSMASVVLDTKEPVLLSNLVPMLRIGRLATEAVSSLFGTFATTASIAGMVERIIVRRYPFTLVESRPQSSELTT